MRPISRDICIFIALVLSQNQGAPTVEFRHQWSGQSREPWLCSRIHATCAYVPQLGSWSPTYKDLLYRITRCFDPQKHFFWESMSQGGLSEGKPYLEPGLSFLIGIHFQPFTPKNLLQLSSLWCHITGFPEVLYSSSGIFNKCWDEQPGTFSENRLGSLCCSAFNRLRSRVGGWGGVGGRCTEDVPTELLLEEPQKGGRRERGSCISQEVVDLECGLNSNQSIL